MVFVGLAVAADQRSSAVALVAEPIVEAGASAEPTLVVVMAALRK